jgi:hypothetical protein
MSFRSTWRWLCLAAGLFAVIFFLHLRARRALPTSPRILPQLSLAAVTSIQVRPAGQIEIRVDRTNQTWQMIRPISYPAQSASIDKFLSALEQLTPAVRLTAHERQNRPKADEEDGLDPPCASLTVQQPGATFRLLIGSNTPPGDQVFVRVVGDEDVCVVDASLLKFLPRKTDDWRDTSLINLKGLAFDRLSVTNGTTVFVLQRDAATQPWRMVYPLQSRANDTKIQESLTTLESLRVNQFLPEDTKTDIEALGLQPADLELDLAQGTNSVAWLQFGKSPTNDAKQVFARRVGQPAIVTVNKDLLAPWRGTVNDFRDPHLLALAGPIGAIEVQGQDQFSVVPETNGILRILPQGFAADPRAVKDLVTDLLSLRVSEFVKDALIEPNLPDYGLSKPILQYRLLGPVSGTTNAATNAVIVQLSFGTNQDGRVFARREDEKSFLYAVRSNDFQALPSASWQLRERQIWNVSTNDVTSLTIRQGGKERQILRQGPNQWSLGPGSTGMIQDLAVEATVRGLTQLAADAWVALGTKSRSDFGLSDTGQQVTLELKSGEKQTLEVGNPPFAAVNLEGQFWIFKLPWLLYRDVTSYLSIPVNAL